jgi:hypothetical protein
MHRPSPHSSLAHRTLLGLVALLPSACEPAPAPAEASGSPAAGGRGALVVVDPQFPQAPEEIDLGVLQFGQVLRHVVRLRNASEVPLTIRDVKPGCSCTQARVRYVDPASGARVEERAGRPGDLITLPAGVTAELELTIDSTLAPVRNKHKLVVVRVTTDSRETPFLTLSLRLLVESAFRPAPAVIDLRQVAQNGGGSGEIGLAAEGDQGRRITEVISCPLELVPDLQLQNVFGVDVWQLRVQLLPPVPLGYHEYELVLGATGPDGVGEGPPVKVSVRATGVPDAGIDPPLVTLAVPPGGEHPEGATLVVTRIPGHTLRVTGARVEGVGPRRIEVEPIPRQPDAQGRAAVWELRLHAREDLGGEPLQGKLVVETDDEQVPRLEARWVWRP